LDQEGWISVRVEGNQSSAGVWDPSSSTGSKGWTSVFEFKDWHKQSSVERDKGNPTCSETYLVGIEAADVLQVSESQRGTKGAKGMVNLSEPEEGGEIEDLFGQLWWVPEFSPA
jgi:hypothetical protein